MTLPKKGSAPGYVCCAGNTCPACYVYPSVKEWRYLCEALSQINSDPAAGHIVASVNQSEAMGPHAVDVHPRQDISRDAVWQGWFGISHRTSRNKTGKFRMEF